MGNVQQSIQKRPGSALLPISFPWVIVLLGALLLLIGNVSNNTFGVFFKPIAGEFGWSRGAVSGAFAVRSLATAVLAMPMGYWSDRYGPRRVVLPCFLLLGVSFLVSAKVTTLWQFYLIQGLLMGIATSGPFVCLISTVARWHDKRPGLALGIATAGTGLSSVIFPPLAAKLILTMGWRGAIAVLGLVTLAVAVPASMFIKDPPRPAKEPSGGRRAEHKGPFEAWRVLPQFLNSRVFLAILLMFLFFYIACNVVTLHLVNYVTDAGIGALVAATMMSVMGIASTTGRLAMGTVSDRIGAKADAVVCCACVTVSLILLSLKLPVLMWVSVVLFGVGYGGASPLIPAIMGERFGTKHLATVTGAALVGANFGGAIGPWMGGLIFDISNSYLWALALAATFTAVALVIALRLPSAMPEARDKGQSLFE